MAAYLDGSMSERDYIELLLTLQRNPEVREALLENLEIGRDIEFLLNRDAKREQAIVKRPC